MTISKADTGRTISLPCNYKLHDREIDMKMRGRASFIDDPEGRELIRAKVPMGRLGDPEEAGELVAFLVSGRSTFMTGQVVNFTGGWP
jgi:NAD(P)-dependent dehydrogenase (short-subunit alcohol dehydrogenase family)